MIRSGSVRYIFVKTALCCLHFRLSRTASRPVNSPQRQTNEAIQRTAAVESGVAEGMYSTHAEYKFALNVKVELSQREKHLYVSPHICNHTCENGTGSVCVCGGGDGRSFGVSHHCKLVRTLL